MKLFFAPVSPYARKCRIVLLERGLEKKVQLVEVNPYEDPPELLAANPIGKVPTLWVDQSFSLCESPVICEYLDSIGEAPRLFPVDPLLRFNALGLAALASGVMDAAVMNVMESRRPPEKRSDDVLKRKENLILRTLAAITPPVEGNFTIGDIALVSALDYLNFRLPALDWRRKFSALGPWYDVVSKRPSCIATLPR